MDISQSFAVCLGIRPYADTIAAGRMSKDRMLTQVFAAKTFWQLEQTYGVHAVFSVKDSEVLNVIEDIRAILRFCVFYDVLFDYH